MSEKVIFLPISCRDVENNYVIPQQAELFEKKAGRRHSWALISPEKFQQHIFLSIIIRNRFDLIIDLRPMPVFRRPNYDHRSLMSNLYQLNILYVDVAKIAQSQSDDFTVFFTELKSKFRSQFDSKNAPFFTLCLTDDSETARCVEHQFRNIISQMGEHIVELHPRSLLM